MEPKALAAANQGIPLGLSGVSGLSLATRKSLQYARKSSLRRGHAMQSSPVLTVQPRSGRR